MPKLATKIESSRDSVKKSLRSSSNSAQHKTEIVVITTLAFLFIVCSFPTFLYRVIGASTWPHLQANEAFQVYSVVADFLLVIGVSVHFYVYVALDPRYVKLIKYGFGRCFRSSSVADVEADVAEMEAEAEASALSELFPSVFGEKKEKKKKRRIKDDDIEQDEQEEHRF